MNANPNDQQESVAYGNPPHATKFKKGQSGNPKGRPRNRSREIPYNHVFGQMVTVRQDGRERRITAAEAFILQLTKKGLAGDSASARASLTAIENARSTRTSSAADLPRVHIRFRSFGLSCITQDLGMGVFLHPTDKDRVRLMLKPWIVDAALDRFGSQPLTADEQRTVLESTRTPDKVRWPAWWSVRPDPSRS